MSKRCGTFGVMERKADLSRMVDVMYPGDEPLILPLSVWVNRKYRTQVAEYLAEHPYSLIIRCSGSESQSAVLEFRKPDGSAVELSDVQAWWNPRHPKNLMPAVVEDEEIEAFTQWSDFMDTLYVAEAVITGYTLESDLMTSGLTASARVNRISLPLTSFHALTHPNTSSTY